MEEKESKKNEARFVAVNIPETFTRGIQDNTTGNIQQDIFEIQAQILNELHLLRKNVG